MKMITLITLLFLLAPGVLAAQNGQLEIYSDPNYVDCFMVDNTTGLRSTYIVHKSPAGASGVHFKVEANGGFTCIYAGAAYGAFWALGTPTTGVAVTYLGCYNTDVLVATITWICQGTSGACSNLSVVADGNYPSGQLVAADCATIPAQTVIPGGTLHVNPDGSCGCSVATQQSTWGQIKALYD